MLDEAALLYAAREWPVAPLHSVRAGVCSCGRPDCTGNNRGKHPRTDHGLDDASTDERTIRAWWRRWNDANVAVRCDRLFVLDVDPRAGGPAFLAELEAAHGKLPDTMLVSTGGGGWHHYFTAPVGRWRKTIAPGLDIQAGRGKYVLAPPSNHYSGGLYRVALDASIVPAPAWLIDAATRPDEVPAPVGQVVACGADLEKRVRAYLAKVPPAISGSGGHTHTLMAAQHVVRGFALDEAVAYSLLAEWNLTCDPPWNEKELRRKIHEAATKGTRVEWGAHLRDSRPAPLQRPPEPPPRTDADAPPPGRSHLSLAPPYVEREPGSDDEDAPPSPPPQRQEVKKGRIEWISTSGIFAALPPTPWLSKDLGLCPGRPALLAAYGYSGKTIISQAQALAFASGREAWGHFATGTPKRVRHFDYEQGQHATRKRYQRLALGMAIDPREVADRLELCVFPSVYLNSTDAVDVYAKETDGVGLVLLDALRGATPGEDENDSKMRACLDMLSRVSEKNGTTFQILHHAGKTNDNHKDPRMILRGSSGIFDACGSVIVLTGERAEPRLVRQVKAPAEAEGATAEEFFLRIEDVDVDGRERAGVRVSYVAKDGQPQAQGTNPGGRPRTSFDDIREGILDTVRKHAGLLKSANAIEARCSLGSRTTRLQAVKELVDEKKLVQVAGAFRVQG